MAPEVSSPEDTCKEFIVMSSYLLYDNKVDNDLSPGMQRTQVGDFKSLTPLSLQRV